MLDCLKTIILKSRYLAKLLINFLFLSGLIELSPIQQALIYSFCENHDKAIQVLDGITLNKPDISMCTLLAKAQMKAKRNKVKNVSVMFTNPINGFLILCLELQLIYTFLNKTKSCHSFIDSSVN